MKCRRPVFFGSLVVSMGGFVSFPSIRTSSKNEPERHSRPIKAPQGSWAQPSDHECAMLPRCRRRGSTYRNRPPKPKSRAPGKGGFVGVAGQLGLLWGASVPTRTRERRLVTGIKISLSALRKSSAARLLQRYRNRPPRAQIEGTWQRGVRGCCGAAGVALGCFSSDPNARAAFGY